MSTSTTLSNRQEVYYRQTVEFVATISIKHSSSAQFVNEGVFAKTFVDESVLPEHEWKYYKNLAGEYHHTDLVPDENGVLGKLKVISLDTNTEIEFSKENLALHTATAESYQYNSRAYKELLIKYPEHETLILGILYPADKDKAIASEDGTIVSYDKRFVEVNEYSLMQRLQRWVYHFLARWENPQFNISDDLYHPVMMTQMQLLMVPALLNLRLKACKTNEAHSFHVFHYLASHGLDQFYLPWLTTKQTLWLYRNICHLEKHAGSRDNFSWLIQNLFTERMLPVAEFRMMHGLEQMPELGTTVLYPQEEFHRHALNLDRNQLGVTPLDLEMMLYKEDSIARDNPIMRVDDLPNISDKIISSLSAELPTKVLESYAIDDSTMATYSLEFIALSHWLYGSVINSLQYVINVTHPGTGQNYTLTAREAACLYLYAYYRQYGIRLSRFQKVHLMRITKLPKPSLNSMLEKVPKKYMSAEEVEYVRVAQPVWKTHVSVRSFNSWLENLFNHQKWQVRWIANHNHNYSRAVAENVVNDLYMDHAVTVSASGFNTYEQWFSAINFPVTGQGDALDYVWGDFAQQIFEQACGIDPQARYTVRRVQQAMIALMTQLSSYSIQFIGTVLDDNTLIGTDHVIRLDDFNPVQEGELFVDLIGVHTHSLKHEVEGQVRIDSVLKVEQAGHEVETISKAITGVEFRLEDYNLVDTVHIEHDGTVIKLNDPYPTPTVNKKMLSVPGMRETWELNSDEVNYLMRNYWCDCRQIDNDKSLSNALKLYQNQLDIPVPLVIPKRSLDGVSIAGAQYVDDPAIKKTGVVLTNAVGAQLQQIQGFIASQSVNTQVFSSMSATILGNP